MRELSFMSVDEILKTQDFTSKEKDDALNAKMVGSDVASSFYTRTQLNLKAPSEDELRVLKALSISYAEQNKNLTTLTETTSNYREELLNGKKALE
jgi:hypothetical protein